MKIERTSFEANPESIGSETYDCVWVRLEDRKGPSPILSPALQWLDWQLQGKLSRLIAGGEAPKQTIFFPTMKQLPVPYVAVDVPGATDWGSFLRNCEGMKLRKVLYFCEPSEQAAAVERELRGLKAQAFPEVIVFGTDPGME